jgi:hypothetical protein
MTHYRHFMFHILDTNRSVISFSPNFLLSTKRIFGHWSFSALDSSVNPPLYYTHFGNLWQEWVGADAVIVPKSPKQPPINNGALRERFRVGMRHPSGELKAALHEESRPLQDFDMHKSLYVIGLIHYTSTPRPLHDGVKAIPSHSYSKEVRLHSKRLETKRDAERR